MINNLLIFTWLVFLITWTVLARGNKKTKLRQKNIFAGISARVFLIIILILLWTVPVFSYQIFKPNLIFQIIGLVVCLLSLLFAFWARKVLGKNWSARIETKEEHQLVTTGPYRLTRHPIYAGVITALMGTFLSMGRLNIFIFLILIALGMVMRSRSEEKLMTQEFPDVYPKYKKNTKF